MLIMGCFLDHHRNSFPTLSSSRKMKHSLLCRDTFSTFQRLVNFGEMSCQSCESRSQSVSAGEETTDKVPSASASGSGFGGTFTSDVAACCQCVRRSCQRCLWLACQKNVNKEVKCRRRRCSSQRLHWIAAVWARAPHQSTVVFVLASC